MTGISLVKKNKDTSCQDVPKHIHLIALSCEMLKSTDSKIKVAKKKKSQHTDLIDITKILQVG